jgi:hypothetical protein
MTFHRYIYLLGLLLLLQACKEEEKPPFTIGSRFSYATAYTYADGRITRHDTLDLTLVEPDITNYNAELKKIKWENTRHDYYQIRNMTVAADKVELQLPLNYVGFDNELIAVAGHPLALLGVPEGAVFNEKKVYQEAYGKLDSMTIFQKTRYLRDTSVEFDGEMLPCRLYLKCNSSGTGTLGRYKMQYTFSPQYGFITLDYFYPNEKHISLRLVDVVVEGR